MMSRIRKVVTGTKDRGASAVEYGLLIAGVALVILAAVLFLGNAINTNFNTVGNAVASPTATS